MAKDNTLLVIGAIILAVLLYKYALTGSIYSVLTPQVQYYDKPIVLALQTDLENSTVETYFKNQLVNATITRGDCSSSGFSGYSVANVSVNVTTADCEQIVAVLNVSEEGVFKIVLTAENSSDIQTVEVKKPFVAVKHDIPASLDKGESVQIKILTFNPHNESLKADSVTLKITKPDDSVDTVILDRGNDGLEYTGVYNYAKAGNYVTRIYANKAGYDTVEQTMITAVLKEEGIHPVIGIWVGMIALILILLLGRRFVWRR